jgi:hypothetical protein
LAEVSLLRQHLEESSYYYHETYSVVKKG